MRIERMGVSLALVATALVGCADTQASATNGVVVKGGDMRNGAYDAPSDWWKPHPEADQGYYYGQVSGAVADTPDRIVVGIRGERTPDGEERPNSSHWMVVVNGQGDVVERWTQWDTTIGFPHQLYISPYDPERHIWVVDRGGSLKTIHEQILKFTNDGSELVMRLRDPAPTQNQGGPVARDNPNPGPYDYGQASTMAFLPNGDFLVGDGYQNGRIIRYNAEGELVSEFGSVGSGPGHRVGHVAKGAVGTTCVNFASVDNPLVGSIVSGNMISFLRKLFKQLASLVEGASVERPSVAQPSSVPEMTKGVPMKKVPSKIGFHTGPGGNPTGIGDYMRALDAAKIPMVLKSVDHYGPIFEAQEIMKKSNVPHLLIFRLSDRHGPDDNYKYDTPPYKDPKYVNDPEGGAEKHWRKTMAKLPPEFDKERVWLEVINEVDRHLCDWLGRFAVRIANLAQRDGYKVSLFAWAGGEPEPSGWETPGMLKYLKLCAERPNQAAVALHEYSYIVDDIFHEFPYKVGRFQYLFQICDKHNIPRPTVHITEWGWTLDTVPVPERAIPDMRKVGELYARFPEIEGAAIWYLGAGFAGIADKAQRLIKPVTEFTLRHRFTVPEGSGDINVPDLGGTPQPTVPEPEPEPEPTPPEPQPEPEPTPPQPDPEPQPEPEPTPPQPDPEPEPEPEPTPPQPEPEPEPQPPQPVPLPNATFVADVTIPDDTRLQAGTTFVKTWRVKNTGNVAWGDGYKLLFVKGTAMTKKLERPLPATPPGQEADISIEFTVPTQPGTYFSDWRMQDDRGNLFGEILFTRIISVDDRPSDGVYVADVTIPDDTRLSAGQSFVKTWRVKNTGKRPWGEGFRLVFVKGTAMTTQRSIPLPACAPGQEVEISIQQTAPTRRGTYFGDWRMQDDRGNLFGEILFLRIVV